MDHPNQPMMTNSSATESSAVRPWVVYSLGAGFVVLLFVCYFAAASALDWLETLVRALFL